ncbi:hypothetical protein HA402_003898 [Bradysia odoriphaga]|nr:hypothetical protein HA402_003898 [Bradysia odoriphaga]
MTTHMIQGKFVRNCVDNVVISRGKVLKLIKINEITGETFNICEQRMTHPVTSLGTMIGDTKDDLFVGLKSGSIMILHYDGKNLVKVAEYQRTFFNRIRIQKATRILSIHGRSLLIQCGRDITIHNTQNRENTTTCSPWRTQLSDELVQEIFHIETQNNCPVVASLETHRSGVLTLNLYRINFDNREVDKLQSKQVDDSQYYWIFSACRGMFLLYPNTIVYTRFGNETNVNCSTENGENVESPHTMIDFIVLNENNILLLSSQGHIFKLVLHIDAKDDVHELSLSIVEKVPVANKFCMLYSKFVLVLCDFGTYRIYVLGENKFGSDRTTTLHTVAEFNSDIHSVFEISVPNTDLPDLQSKLEKTSFGHKHTYTGVSIEIHNRIMRILSQRSREITMENLSTLHVDFRTSSNVLTGKKFICQWMSHGSNYTLKMQDENDYKKLFDSYLKCTLKNTDQTKVCKEARLLFPPTSSNVLTEGTPPTNPAFDELYNELRASLKRVLEIVELMRDLQFEHNDSVEVDGRVVVLVKIMKTRINQAF